MIKSFIETIKIAEEAYITHRDVFDMTSRYMTLDGTQMSEEKKIEIWEMITGAVGQKSGMSSIISASRRYRLYGALAPYAETIERATIGHLQDRKALLEIVKDPENRLKFIAWFAFKNKFQSYNAFGNYNFTEYSIGWNGYESQDNTSENRKPTTWQTIFSKLKQVTLTKNDYLEGISKYKEAVNNLEIRVKNSIQEYEGNAKGLVKLIEKAPVQSMKEHDEIISEAIKLSKQLPVNGLAARTWGFEIESPDCKGVKAVQGSGIEKGDDGSLRSYEGNESCECGCEDCTYHECDCDNCGNQNTDPEHCSSRNCTQCESAEFRTTGGISRVKHTGMYKLCEDLKEVEAEINDSAGTHIHVFAADIGIKAIGQVLVVYKHLENIFGAVAGRSDVSYAQRLDVNHIKKALDKKDPRLIREKSRAVNVSHLFNERGTLEFRQMDCNYNANLITFWAWLVRGLVETCYRGAKLNNFINVKTLQDVVEVYAQFKFTMQNEMIESVIPGTKTDEKLIIRKVYKGV